MATNTHRQFDAIPKATPEQNAYADLLFYGCWVGLAVMLVTYCIYISGVIPPHVPLEKMPEVWASPVSVYLEKASVPVGWGWVALIREGDFLNFLGIVILAGLSVLCYIRIIPALFRRGDPLMGFIAIAEVVVLVFAASGIVGGGAH